jgi:hypothetical protein
MLFSRCEYKIRSAIHAFEVAVLKLRHGLIPVDDLEQFIGPQAGDESRLVHTPGFCYLFHFPARLLPVSFTGQSLLNPQLLTRLEVKGVTLHFFNDVLLLDLTLEAAKGILEGFTLLKFYFCQTKYTSPLDLEFPCDPGVRRGSSHTWRLALVNFLHIA